MNVVRRFIAENKPHAHHKTHLHTIKVYNTRPVCLTMEVLLFKILLFFDHWSNHLFQSNQRFQAIEIVNRPVPEKLVVFTLTFPELSMHGFRHAASLIPRNK